MISLSIRCVPPSITAQKKRVHVIQGKDGKHRPVFFHGAKMKAEEQTWTSLLSPHVPEAPLDGPLILHVRMVWPHLKATRQADRERLIPKVSKPDCSNVSKHLEDLLVKLRFIVNDAHVARHVVEKFHGPEAQIGIRIVIQEWNIGG